MTKNSVGDKKKLAVWCLVLSVGDKKAGGLVLSAWFGR